MNVKAGHKLTPPMPEEDDTIDRGIADDPDTWEATNEEWQKARPAREAFAETGLPLPKKRGRPPKKAPKQQVTIRLDADLLADLRALGKGWQTQVNAALREWIERREKDS